jgi:hypothetical protein
LSILSAHTPQEVHLMRDVHQCPLLDLGMALGDPPGKTMWIELRMTL